MRTLSALGCTAMGMVGWLMALQQNGAQFGF